MSRILALPVLLLAPAWLAAHEQGAIDGHPGGRIECTRGAADEFGCRRIDLLAHLSLASLAGGSAANDIWGWTDALDGREYVLIGTFKGVVVVDIGDPEAPVKIGMLPAHDELRCARLQNVGKADDCGDEGSAWRDIKVYKDHAYVVSEAFGHGLQVFDLGQLRSSRGGEQTFAESSWFGGFGDAHNIAINEDTGYAYVVGSTRYGGGPYFIDLSDPVRPVAAGGYGADGYTHDAQCVVYRGPDADHQGAEICFLSNEDTVTVLDVSVKSAPVRLARAGYGRASYTHQGWLDETQRWFYVNDEQDENRFGGRTATYIWDMSDLDAPRLQATYEGLGQSIDHNNYVRGDYLYQSNYTSGLRVLDISTPDAPLEVAYFDSFPSDDHLSFNGTWSNYPYFASGVIALSDKDNGLFLLRHRAPTDSGDLQVALNAVSQPDPAQLSFQYSATVTNAGAAAVDDVVVVHLLDSDTVSYATDAGADCAQRERWVECAIGRLGAGASRAIVVTQDAAAAGTKRAGIQASGMIRDAATRNNKATATITLQSGSAPTPAPTPPVAAPGGGGGGALLWAAFVAALLRLLRRASAARDLFAR